jgi:hypothetical protein
MNLASPQLNDDQQKAVDAVSAFIVGADKEFFLTGGPGVGKTFTTRELATILPSILKAYNVSMGKKNTNMDLVLTSTTNKAAAVLSEHTGLRAVTIHSFLNVIPDTDYTTGKTNLRRTSNYRVHTNCMIFIDEASMIDRDLYQILMEATDDTCKIIYIGDKNQLPPVMEKISPAVVLAEEAGRHYEITTPVRNAGAPALQSLCEGLKEDILLERTKAELTKWKKTPGQIEYINGTQLQDLIDAKFGPNGTVKATDVNLGCRMLCFTNSAVMGYNEYIRNLRGLPSHPTAGEILVCNTHFPLNRSDSFSVEENVMVHGVYGPEPVEIDNYNKLDAYMLEVSSGFTGRFTVKCPADREAWKKLRSHYRKHKDWQKFYKLQEEWIDLRDREAATVYKAQGSTYDEVILIMSDIFVSRDINQLRRMLYVGASRARKKVYVYDKGIHENTRGIFL